MNQEPAPPPEELRPWYYQNLFLIAAFVLPPSWSVLILRSPWHNGIFSGGLAWACLIVGAFVAFKSVQDGSGSVVIVFIVPGLALTLATQAHWAGYKKQFIDPLNPPAPTPPEVVPTSGEPVAPGESPRPARRYRARRRSRPGRTPRR